ncbi:hypothetical protein LUW76_36020 [Actinomadura madurae]|uniref:hypothetical protein n=1 Tax=Actinomadura madurae TaxID=1993 RepID=UPI002026DAB4|nr:hypothetical protein [Actinomadura madurae]URM99302.1 hypothetical protein LUW76_36020 [Actinomadura madurae]
MTSAAAVTPMPAAFAAAVTRSRRTSSPAEKESRAVPPAASRAVRAGSSATPSRTVRADLAAGRDPGAPPRAQLVRMRGEREQIMRDVCA